MWMGCQTNTFLLLRGLRGREYDIKVSPSKIIGDSQILKFFEKKRILSIVQFGRDQRGRMGCALLVLPPPGGVRQAEACCTWSFKRRKVEDLCGVRRGRGFIVCSPGPGLARRRKRGCIGRGKRLLRGIKRCFCWDTGNR